MGIDQLKSIKLVFPFFLNLQVQYTNVERETKMIY